MRKATAVAVSIALALVVAIVFLSMKPQSSVTMEASTADFESTMDFDEASPMGGLKSAANKSGLECADFVDKSKPTKKEKCGDGETIDSLGEKYAYYYNAARNTSNATCGEKLDCWCCRREVKDDATSYLDKAASAGDTEIYFKDYSGFTKGDSFVIGDISVKGEVASIAGFVIKSHNGKWRRLGSKPIIAAKLNQGLTNSYSANTPIKKSKTGYIAVTDGYCQYKLTASYSCAVAAASLGFNASVATVNTAIYPTGCSATSGKTFFNMMNNSKPCDEQHTCICPPGDATSAPTPSPPPEQEACFAGEAHAHTQGGSLAQMDSIQVGDVVLVNGVRDYEVVYGHAHAFNDDQGAVGMMRPVVQKKVGL